MAVKLYVGDAAIRKGIGSLDKVLGNVNDRIQDLAVSIITHAAGPGNGDMSRALDLCKVVAKRRTLNVAFLIGYFRYFGNANVNLRAKDGAGQVSLIARDAKAYRGGFDVEGAKHNRWDEAFNDAGERAPWYVGPAPATFEPATIGDIAADFERFVKREMDKLNGTKEVGGKVVPLVQISDTDRKQLDNAFDFINRIAKTLSRHEEVEKLTRQREEAEAAAKEDEQVLAVIEPQERAVA